jgi:hypothetical protein
MAGVPSYRLPTCGVAKLAESKTDVAANAQLWSVDGGVIVGSMAE